MPYNIVRNNRELFGMFREMKSRAEVSILLSRLLLTTEVRSALIVDQRYASYIITTSGMFFFRNETALRTLNAHSTRIRYNTIFEQSVRFRKRKKKEKRSNTVGKAFRTCRVCTIYNTKVRRGGVRDDRDRSCWPFTELIHKVNTARFTYYSSRARLYY